MKSRRRKPFSVKFAAGDDGPVKLRRARKSDRTALVDLYCAIYGEDYPLEIVKEPAVMNKCLTSPDYFWPVMESRDGDLIGSVLFCFEERLGMCKVFGAVIRPDWQGHDLMRKSIVEGLDYLIDSGVDWQVMYATTRTVSPAPERLVRRIGFRTLGVFPNVRKVKKYETHGLNVLFRKGALDLRLRKPRLVPEVADFFYAAKAVCELDDEPLIEEVELPEPEPRDLRFSIIREPREVASRFNEAWSGGRLKFSFFPFHEPQVILESEDGLSEVYLHHNTFDNYGCILGLHTAREDFGGFLDQACEGAARLGLKYIELLVSAFDPVKQRQALDAHFLPCAYFPAMKPFGEGKRMDYLVFSRSFERLDFTSINVSGDGARFLSAFIKGWYRHLLKNEPDFSRWDSLSS